MSEQAEQETFAHAVATSEDMTLQQKVHWLSISAEDLFEKLQATERDLATAQQRIAGLEAELARAREALQWIAGLPSRLPSKADFWPVDQDKARAALTPTTPPSGEASDG